MQPSYRRDPSQSLAPRGRERREAVDHLRKLSGKADGLHMQAEVDGPVAMMRKRWFGDKAIAAQLAAERHESVTQGSNSVAS